MIGESIFEKLEIGLVQLWNHSRSPILEPDFVEQGEWELKADSMMNCEIILPHCYSPIFQVFPFAIPLVELLISKNYLMDLFSHYG